ncbi:MAG: hypothetical protein WKF78_01620 [Candidatus Limnocylindrales bacterium]
MSESELVAFWSGMSSVSGSREMTTPAAWVRRVPGDALELPGEVDDPLDSGIGLDLLAQGGRGLERLVELDPELVRDGLGDPVDLAVAVTQDPAHIADARRGRASCRR